MLNCLDPDAIEWPMRTPETVVAAARVAAGLWAHDGPREREVEEQLRQALDVLDVTMVTSGTAALRVMYRALMAWGRLHGRKVTGKPRVIMSKLTFQATAAAAVDSGLAVDMVDVDPVTLLPTTEAIRAAITPDTVGSWTCCCTRACRRSTSGARSPTSRAVVRRRRGAGPVRAVQGQAGRGVLPRRDQVEAVRQGGDLRRGRRRLVEHPARRHARSTGGRREGARAAAGVVGDGGLTGCRRSLPAGSAAFRPTTCASTSSGPACCWSS